MIGCFGCLITDVQLQPTVRLQLYRRISKNEGANAPITFEEIVMVVITCSNLITLLFRGFKIF